MAPDGRHGNFFAKTGQAYTPVRFVHDKSAIPQPADHP
jgi:hypothetical protein